MDTAAGRGLRLLPIKRNPEVQGKESSLPDLTHSADTSSGQESTRGAALVCLSDLAIQCWKQ